MKFTPLIITIIYLRKQEINLFFIYYSEMIENSSALKKHFLSSILPYQEAK